MKRFGNSQINVFATDYDSEEGKIYIPTIQNEQVVSILEKAWHVYKTFSAWSLRNLTHEKDSPWDKTKTIGTSIASDCVKTYYLEYLDKLLSEEC